MNFPKLDFYELLSDEQKRVVDTPVSFHEAEAYCWLIISDLWYKGWTKDAV